MRQLKMTIGSVVLEAKLLDTPTAEAIWNACPFTIGFGRTPISQDNEIRLAAQTNH